MNEFSKAFNGVEDEEMTPAPADEMVTEDNKNESAPDAQMEMPTVAVEISADEPVDAEAPEVMADDGEPVVESSDLVEDDAMDDLSPEDLHRQKSWEGRLKKREEELAAREASMGAEASDEEVEALKAQLANDFGQEFVDMICKVCASESRKLAGGALNEAINPINQTISQAISDVQNAFKSLHFSAIADAHEDFQEIVNSDGFAAFVDGLQEEEKSRAAEIIQSGTPKQVIALLNQYKASLSQPDQASTGMDAALDAAEGVRGSSPVSLPGRVPVGDDDEYKSAWDSM